MKKKIGEEPQNRFKIKAHLPFPWMWDIIRNDNILDAIEDIIGPDILWGLFLFHQERHDARPVSRHQDSTYYGLSERATLSVWYAFSLSNVESGCMRFILGTHDKGLYDHDETGDANNTFDEGPDDPRRGRGQNIDVITAARRIFDPPRGSRPRVEPEQCGSPRVGISIHYIYMPRTRCC